MWVALTPSKKFKMITQLPAYPVYPVTGLVQLIGDQLSLSNFLTPH